ncbi:hypothetical protein [Lysinibacillus agricola]|uniref:hypothetical protein n=1 Tax=Lysinibacillus agricola TaxID=2590012 RepID=UPI003C1C40A5
MLTLIKGGVISGVRNTVKATDGAVQAGGVNYNIVIVLEETSVYSGVWTYYFVDGIGLVKELYKDVVIYELLDRTAN